MRLQILSFSLAVSSVLSVQALTPREAADAILGRNGDYLEAMTMRDADNLDASTLANAPDPEVSGAYILSPKDVVNRWNAGITYSMEWPGVYGARRNMAKATKRANDAGVNAVAAAKRLEILEKIEEYLYADRRLTLMSHIVSSTDSLRLAAERALRGGEMSKLDLAKINLEEGKQKAQISKIQSEKAALEGELRTFNGGYPCEALLERIDRDAPDEPLLPIDIYLESAHRNPDFLKTVADFESAKQNVKVVGAEALPSVAVGYAHQFEDDMHFNEANLAVSIPLFANRGKKKAATAAVAAAEYSMTAQADRIESQVKSLHSRISEIDDALNVPDNVFHSTEYTTLLLKAYKGGEISIVDYMQEQNWFMETHFDYLEMKYLRNSAMSMLQSLTMSPSAD